eukprot:g73132.t1
MNALRKLIPQTQVLKTSPNQLRVDDKVITDPKGIANALNRHYTTVGSKVFDTILSKQLMAHLTRKFSSNTKMPEGAESLISKVIGPLVVAERKCNKLFCYLHPSARPPLGNLVFVK